MEVGVTCRAGDELGVVVLAEALALDDGADCATKSAELDGEAVEAVDLLDPCVAETDGIGVASEEETVTVEVVVPCRDADELGVAALVEELALDEGTGCAIKPAEVDGEALEDTEILDTGVEVTD